MYTCLCDVGPVLGTQLKEIDTQAMSYILTLAQRKWLFSFDSILGCVGFDLAHPFCNGLKEVLSFTVDTMIYITHL